MGKVFDSDESKEESHELASEDESSKSEDAFSFKKHNIAHGSAKSSNGEASDDGNGSNQVNQPQQRFISPNVRQRPARQQQAPLVWRMAHRTAPCDSPFTVLKAASRGVLNDTVKCTDILKQMCKLLMHIHAQGFLHNDLEAYNVVINKAKNYTVFIDFRKSCP